MEFARIAGGKVIAMDINEQRLKFCSDYLGVQYTINPLHQQAIQEIGEITGGDMPTVVIDATGSLGAINSGFSYMAHGARYVLVGLQKGEISFSHPEFHKREATLMSSRNATKEDFLKVMTSMTLGLVKPSTYITHRVRLEEVKGEFPGWLDPQSGVIKAMVELN
jgi:threonine dehydrogenase-like Zn-dependent dehydrogenase